MNLWFHICENNILQVSMYISSPGKICTLFLQTVDRMSILQKITLFDSYPNCCHQPSMSPHLVVCLKPGLATAATLVYVMVFESTSESHSFTQVATSLWRYYPVSRVNGWVTCILARLLHNWSNLRLLNLVFLFVHWPTTRQTPTVMCGPVIMCNDTWTLYLRP